MKVDEKCRLHTLSSSLSVASSIDTSERSVDGRVRFRSNPVIFLKRAESPLLADANSDGAAGEAARSGGAVELDNRSVGATRCSSSSVVSSSQPAHAVAPYLILLIAIVRVFDGPRNIVRVCCLRLLLFFDSTPADLTLHKKQ